MVQVEVEGQGLAVHGQLHYEQPGVVVQPFEQVGQCPSGQVVGAWLEHELGLVVPQEGEQGVQVQEPCVEGMQVVVGG
jgi:hypothetical protein